MAYFPFYIDIENKHCLVVGGGIVALRKVEVMLPYGVIFHIVAPEVQEEILEMAASYPDQFVIERRGYEEADLNNKDFVVAASSDEELNHRISVICKERGIMINVVDVKKDCSFIVPAIIHKDNFDIAVSSGGRSPAAASYLKRKVQESIPSHYDRLVHQMGEWRAYVKEQVDSQKKRADAFQLLLEAGIANDCELTKEMVDEIIEPYK
ncbi:MAG: bifunctional precorrin-2 dehydrogenase/sirohydrochlorin ferrochelatase [Lachnospiraceae bacterium]|nr:bifunctional precorrin-2 dehydrogenase/sirohydrochlorin ferrochelatase [Lachnospiraceae bacterium]